MDDLAGKHRRVSISDPAPISGIDNPSFEHHHNHHNNNIIANQQQQPITIEPGRKKSILHNNSSVPGSVENLNNFDNVDVNGGKHPFSRKKSAYSLSSSIREKVEYTDELQRSWLYLFCTRCHGPGDTDSWEPSYWRLLCPHPFCPTYRKFAQSVCVVLLGLLLWGVVYSIMGDDVAPGGPLFTLACVAIVAYFTGWLFTLARMPALIGMLVAGIVIQNLNLLSIDTRYAPVVSDLRKIALVIILTRAGLDLDPKAMKAMKFTVPKIGLLPWLAEAGVVTLTTYYFMDLPWSWGFLVGSVVAAVSPAVVVPCLFRLRSKGYGVAKGIPTLIIAIAGIDDAASVAAYGILQSIMFSQDALWYQILQGPIAIFGGIGFGVLWGALSRYVPEKGDPFVIPLRVMMLLGGGMLSVFGSELIHLGGAGPLAVVAGAFVSFYFWQKDGLDVEDNPISTSFEIFWMIFEPILFGVTGMQIKLNELDNTVYVAMGCLGAAVIIRMLVTVLVGVGSRFNLKEKIFIAVACMAKATVQAALAPGTLDKIDPKNEIDKRRAEIVLMLCVLSIMMTAPTGALLIMISGPKLLTKTRAPIATIGHDGWRSRRPSIRDISIIDELPDLEDPKSTGTPTITEIITNNQHIHNNFTGNNHHR